MVLRPGRAWACDLRIVSDNARFTVAFFGIGLVPDAGVSLLLPALIGLGRATEFTFSNQPITAAQALEWGMANRVVPASDLMSETIEIAAGLADGPVAVYGLTKRLFNKSMLPILEKALELEAELQENPAKVRIILQG